MGYDGAEGSVQRHLLHDIDCQTFDLGPEHSVHGNFPRSRTFPMQICHILHIILTTVLFTLVVIMGMRLKDGPKDLFATSGRDPSRALYSPADEEVEYIFMRFNRSRGEDKSLFQGWPSDGIDAHWQAHYMPGMLSTIDQVSASKLPDETARFARKGEEHKFVVTLDIFHQMHCLDIVRKALYRDRYDKHFYRKDGSVDFCKWLHVDHCLDQVRQALMCQADVSVVPFQWSDIVEGMRPRVDNSHTCRNYTKILEWAAQRQVPAEQWHPSQRVVLSKSGDRLFEIETGRNEIESGSDLGECNAI